MARPGRSQWMVLVHWKVDMVEVQVEWRVFVAWRKDDEKKKRKMLTDRQDPAWYVVASQHLQSVEQRMD